MQKFAQEINFYQNKTKKSQSKCGAYFAHRSRSNFRAKCISFFFDETAVFSIEMSQKNSQCYFDQKWLVRDL